MSEEDNNFDDLISEALKNALDDRKSAGEAWSKMKEIFDQIDPGEPGTMQGVMFAGSTAVKLLEAKTRANEQIIKLAQLKQKDKPIDKTTKTPINLDEIKKEFSKVGS